ncbi:MAG TPA: HEPN domain-containing protein [Spirochaetota bacterium]|nr:HEPN domain-containing protein [Spirochaetota bacterium]HNT12429.1 HEPN domain-containing protein [Spirochaetota bacterium]
MSPEEIVPGSPADWLRFAVSDLELARRGRSPEVMLEILCFHAQQAAEKALKALIISTGLEVPRTHNIKTLLDIIADHASIPETLTAASLLTDYSVSSRYPGISEPVTDAEYDMAIHLAQMVIAWVRDEL